MLKTYFAKALRDCNETINNDIESSNQIGNGNLDVERGTLDEAEKNSGKQFLLGPSWWIRRCSAWEVTLGKNTRFL